MHLGASTNPGMQPMCEGCVCLRVQPQTCVCSLVEAHMSRCRFSTKRVRIRVHARISKMILTFSHMGSFLNAANNLIVRELGLSSTAMIKLFPTFTYKAPPALTPRHEPFAVLELHSKQKNIYIYIYIYT